jgi:hypothetical protein
MQERKRLVCWFSCGAASAVATKLALQKNQMGEQLPVVIARVWLAEEHEDNDRFAKQCEEWFGHPITVLTSEKYKGSIFEVFKKERYIVGPSGAPCSKRLKKWLREAFELPGDRQVFGYTSNEQGRVDRFLDANNHVDLWTPLLDLGYDHGMCRATLRHNGIAIPKMYELGYKNNNCIGCVKGGAGYWNKIRVDFPQAFERMAAVERGLNVAMLRKNGEKLFLDQLPPTMGRYKDEPEPECGIFCEMKQD